MSFISYLILQIKHLIMRDRKCKNEVKYLNKKIKILTKISAESIIPIHINFKLTGVVNPHNLIDCVAADHGYDTFSLSDWKKILNNAHDIIKSRFKYESSIFDCDDFALILSSIITYSAYTSGMKLQPAFGIVWSKTHAYNLFIANNKIYIYEPQTNTIMSLIEAKKIDRYNPNKVWFMS